MGTEHHHLLAAQERRRGIEHGTMPVARHRHPPQPPRSTARRHSSGDADESGRRRRRSPPGARTCGERRGALAGGRPRCNVVPVAAQEGRVSAGDPPAPRMATCTVQLSKILLRRYRGQSTSILRKGYYRDVITPGPRQTPAGGSDPASKVHVLIGGLCLLHCPVAEYTKGPTIRRRHLLAAPLSPRRSPRPSPFGHSHCSATGRSA